jgi:hypothetical protein
MGPATHRLDAVSYREKDTKYNPVPLEDDGESITMVAEIWSGSPSLDCHTYVVSWACTVGIRQLKRTVDTQRTVALSPSPISVHRMADILVAVMTFGFINILD